MIKTIIVDDDIEMLEGLENFIDWQEYGFEVVGKAENGLQALELIKEKRPKLIITDITMPSMDGLKLIKLAKEIDENIKSIILTCHEDFSYAKEALELQADSYIVKLNLTEESIANSLSEVKEKINTYSKSQKRSWELNKNKHLIKNHLFKDALEADRVGMERILDRKKAIGIPYPTAEYKAVGLIIESDLENKEDFLIKDDTLLRFSLNNIFDEFVQNMENITFFEYDKEVYIFLYWNSESRIFLDNKITLMFKKLQKIIYEILKLKVSVYIGDEYENLFQLPDVIKEIFLIREEYFYEMRPVIAKKSKKEFNTLSNELASSMINEFRIITMKNNEEEMKNYIDQLIHNIHQYHYPPKEVYHLFRDMKIILDAEANRNGITINSRNQSSYKFEVASSRITEYIMCYYSEIKKKSNYSSREDINSVLRFIDSHLYENITCEKMAEYVNLNNSYFSRLFKQEMGLNFSKYLINKRIERATILLRDSDLSIDEIIETIGLENKRYFYKIYKQKTGMTPGSVKK